MRALFVWMAAAAALGAADFRPPAVPLVAHDPYFSIWSMADRLTDDDTRHWTGARHALTGLVRVDGKTYRVMGRERGLEALAQISVEVLPTRTVYRFAGAGIELTLTFLTPALPHDLDVLSRPLTYVVWTVRAGDGRAHDVEVYFDASGEIAANVPEQALVWGRVKLGEFSALRVGTEEQPVLGKSGDNLRIDWGWLYVAPGVGAGASEAIFDGRTMRAQFTATGKLPEADDTAAWHRRFHNPALAVSFDLGRVSGSPATRYTIIAYDDGYGVEYFERRVRPWWRRKGDEASDLLVKARAGYAALSKRCEAFDGELMTDLRNAGGEEYARLAALAYRQTIAAHKLSADLDGSPLFFSKENFSNGSINTVDVTYPSAPFFLLFSPKLLRGQIGPILDYAKLERWRFPFAPHDLGTYPLANGQTYGGGEKTEENQMPVEESGNMLLMTAALTKIEGTSEFAQKHWPVLERWATYLKEKGLDPENQLCTDDFAGHLAHNANLSIKAILALAAFGQMAELTGRAQMAAEYLGASRAFAKKWVELARDGDHYKLAFDKPGTWSQKYNLVWDRLLGLNLFPAEIARTEMAYYLKRQKPYGLPLDNRETYTKLDWILWTATMAESGADFRALAGPAYRFANETPTRVPLSDWYWTQDAKQRGFQARSVVGGVFIRLLADEAVWRKWAAK